MALSDDLKDMIEHDNARARRILHEIVETEPRSLEARHLLARSYLRSMEVADAIPHYRAVVALDGKIVEARHALGFCHFSLGDYAAALAAYREAFAVGSTAHALAMCGLILHRMNRLDEAIDAYNKVLVNVAPTSAIVFPALQGIAAAWRDAHRATEAERYVKDLVERFHQNPANVALHLTDRNNSLDFHEWWRYEDKERLAAALQRYTAAGAKPLRFPETFILPQQRDALAALAAGNAAPRILIAKPSHGTGGQGITVTSDVASIIDRTDVVVQRYLDRPYLVDGRKGHLRLYGLIASAAPLRVYLYREGIVRFAPETYDARPESLANNAMHVTNTALHRGNPNLVVSTDAAQENVGHVWSLTAYLRRLTEDGMDSARVFAKIKALVESFVGVLAGEGLFQRQARHRAARAFTPKLFGLDVLIDAEGEPWLIEMQAKPALAGSPLVTKVNGELFATIFRMSVAPVIEEGMTPAEQHALLTDAAAVAQRELAIETAHQGGFVRLDVG
jgi:Tfp pilus assembly protein PilF